MSINKLNDLTRRLNKAMRSIMLNSDPDLVKVLGECNTVNTDTWERIGRLLRTDVTLHPNYTERVEKKYDDLFTNSDSDHAYMAHVVDGTCICWNGDIECGATEEERKDILNFRKGFKQDWWEKNT